MGLVLAIIVAVGTLVVALLAAFANGMSDAPSMQGFSIWPILIGGELIAAALAFTHYVPLHW